MTSHYPLIWRELQALKRFEKYASDSADAQVDLARTADRVFDLFQEKSAAYGALSDAVSTAKAAAAFAVDLYDTARGLGEKVASESSAADTIEQLATVAYVDHALKVASESMSPAEQQSTAHVRLLGREYGAALLKSLVG